MLSGTGGQTVDSFLSNSHSYIDDMLAKRSNLRIPVKHIAPNANELAPIPSDDEANVSDDEVEQIFYELIIQADVQKCWR